MIVFPAIDLKDGTCVRLVKGDMAQATEFNKDPVDQAKTFEKHGFSWLHIVDLNGAFEGKPINSKAVTNIIKATKLNVQLGGGIRTLSTIEHWLNSGVKRVILGTVALKNPDLVYQACIEFPGQIVVSIDGRHGKVATEGWAEISETDIITLGKKLADAHIAAFVYTDIERDGILTGPDFAGSEALAKATNLPVIVSGGIASIKDLEKVKQLSTQGTIEGAIVGRAIYDGRIDMQQAAKL